jgi:hypothetical protein
MTQICNAVDAKHTGLGAREKLRLGAAFPIERPKARRVIEKALSGRLTPETGRRPISIG